jgi:protein-S-isoprenylcysteine O-methyltransferase Ste14
MLVKIADYGERLFLVVLCAIFVRSLVAQAHVHPYVLLLAISECLPVLLILIRREGQMPMEPYPFIVAFIGTAAPLLVRPAVGGLSVIPDALAATLVAFGLVLNISAKLALWRSFGLTAANRGVRKGGPYKLVRHPMYLGYFITQAAFLLANLSVGNMIKYFVGWSFQILRIREEEKFLMKDESYRELVQRVRFRVVPGIY